MMCVPKARLFKRVTREERGIGRHLMEETHTLKEIESQELHQWLEQNRDFTLTGSVPSMG